ncbi:DUF411 domain-containing protein [Ferrovibrio sp.]|uniref:DUF411 domain-containing protein n=1 Tax=Ferrovibrio sp. TaxID=1917215 RepID=UPI00311D3737
MNRFHFITLMASALIFPMTAMAQSTPAILYKNPQCGCCEGYAEYMRKNGFQVDVKAVHNLSEISQKAGIPSHLEGCHTMLIDGYVVDGHVPANIVRKLLRDRPDIAGITLPGMPAGSPGMGGEKSGPFTVYSVPKNGGKPFLYATE